MSLRGALARALGGKPTAVEYPHAERDLAKNFGLGHELLTAARAEHLKRGRDWEMVGGLVCYSAGGRERVMGALKMATPAPASPPPLERPPTAEIPPEDSAPNAVEKITPAPWLPPARGDVRELVCVRVPLNRRMVECRAAAPGGPAQAWVRVKDNHNFRTGMRVPARFLEGERWELVGRCPRWPGKF